MDDCRKTRNSQAKGGLTLIGTKLLRKFHLVFPHKFLNIIKSPPASFPTRQTIQGMKGLLHMPLGCPNPQLPAP